MKTSIYSTTTNQFMNTTKYLKSSKQMPDSLLFLIHMIIAPQGITTIESYKYWTILSNGPSLTIVMSIVSIFKTSNKIFLLNSCKPFFRIHLLLYFWVVIKKKTASSPICFIQVVLIQSQIIDDIKEICTIYMLKHYNKLIYISLRP